MKHLDHSTQKKETKKILSFLLAPVAYLKYWLPWKFSKAQTLEVEKTYEVT